MDIKYGAISLDTNILYKQGFNFSSGLLSELRKFKNSDIKVLVTEIVHKESVKHLSETIEKDYLSNAINIVNNIRKYQKYSPNIDAIKIANSFDKLFRINESSEVLAEEFLNLFYESIGAELVKCDEISVRDLIDMYFLNTPLSLEEIKNRNFLMLYFF
ncbi:PIN domain-containing protein [Actinobacillus equuli]|uniref:PIN domain-containing protein n=1 Tax=Actinobacillus equuli TaxID=718 RepID=UPI0024429C51|nr:PIN domain-containing protein [Actinobacillus equuli]WGE75160.1 PIN domain-containing protein [Actinobacillus equuli subsp. haemolyticus]WGE77074.1 PIN domain-containing protein [Actinobacillus equuli subsp. haemolyticus]